MQLCAAFLLPSLVRHSQFTAFALSGKRNAVDRADSSEDFRGTVHLSPRDDNRDELVRSRSSEQDHEMEDAHIDNELDAWGPCLLFAACVMVFTQCMVVAAVMSGTGTKSCEYNYACDIKGTYCRSVGGTVDRCSYCGADSPLAIQVDVQTGESYLLRLKPMLRTYIQTRL